MLRFFMPFVSLLFFLLSNDPVPGKSGAGCDPNGLCKGVVAYEPSTPSVQTQAESGAGCDPDGVR